MGRHLVHYLPIITTAVTVPFGLEVFRRFRQHPDRLHLLWWALGIVTYGVGTLTESLTTIIGWREPIFRAWYISGALLTELMGLLLIWAGYRMSVAPAAAVATTTVSSG